MNRKRLRLYLVIASVAVLGLAAFLVLTALQTQLVFFRSPSDIAKSPPAAGNWATSPNKDLVGKPVEDAFYKDHKDGALKGEAAVGDEVSSLLEGDSFSVLVPVHFEDSPNVWTLLVTVPRSVILGSVDDMVKWSILIGVGILVVCLLIAWGVGSSTARPVRRMAQVMKELASGKLDAVIPATARRDRTIKMGWYRTYGVQECWLVDPNARTIGVHDLTAPIGTAAASYGGRDVMRSSVLTGLRLPLGDLFDLY